MLKKLKTSAQYNIAKNVTKINTGTKNLTKTIINVLL